MICLYLYILFLVLKVSEGLTLCHNTDCVSCDCFNQTLIPRTITCNEYQVIRLEFYSNRRVRYSHFLGDRCNLIDNQTFTCLDTNIQTYLLDFQEKLKIYHACNAKRRCEVTVPTEMPVKVEIPFVCEWETTLRRISSKITQTSDDFPIFHFSGAEYKGNVLNCDCKIEMREMVLFEVFFINLGPEACKRVIISNNNISIFRCTENGLQVLYGMAGGNIEGQMRIQIVDLVAEGDEVLYFKLRGLKMSVQCSGCSVEKSGNTTNLTETPPESSTKTIVSSTEIPPLEESTDTSSVIWVTALSINGVVIILICIANMLYCIRRKKLSKKPAKVDTQISEYEHYVSLDDYSTTPHNATNRTNSHQYLHLIDGGDYLVPLAQPEPHQTNGHSMVNNTTPVIIHNGLAASISSEYGYNRAVTSTE